ncbi:thioredoxin domain-containing protein [Allokutzneria sp. A3M-2-11 16]|uniref:thioredoxin domain-containing protein n=1 Tax=Allokutzneria sp. A3M-2-11 16 TaxID=2962043 RepID=UPI0020B7AB89|nr:thioredoxin domain-containing protein [Allokutzneria sp. A3M-2-11 16]MCP3798692.1 thioredoxin domain-containing protein [Allokutzneria sp. A3M-2-11 16]
MPNRLAESTSPYLLQHADNPVDWWPWGEEAFAEARRREVPVLLSVGYAACHWCHVMAHESFEDPATAELMNANFVNVKVDREERPDVDAVYMEATQAMTGHGGWPMTCFLTPDGEPFHCGTYYPPAPRQGMPSFAQLLQAVGEAWRERGEEVREAATRIVTQLTEQASPLPVSTVDSAVLSGAVSRLMTDFDASNGGFGAAPKFPPSMVLEFLLRHHERTGSVEALTMAEDTFEAMARGGMYDQLAGGFARYSVDASWVVPHFEKMLYDNALLLRGYAHLARRTGSSLARRVAAETAEFLIGEMLTPEGGFAASLDADTEGVEGLTYAWTPAQLTEVLGAEDGEWAALLLEVTGEGTFEDGMSTLQLRSDPDNAERWERVRAQLLGARAGRPQPGRDDKVVTAWNGMAIAALADAGAALDRPQWIEAAISAADLLLRKHYVDGRLLRSSRDGVAGRAAGVLEDYGCLAEGLLALYQATTTPKWLHIAMHLLDTSLDRFADPNAVGVFYDTADDAEKLVRRPSDVSDNASPCGSSSLAGALLTASALAGADRAARYRDAAEHAIARAGLLAARAPRFAGWWLAVAEARERGPLQVAIVGAAGDERRQELARAALSALPGGALLLVGEPDDGPLLANRPLVDDGPAAYVCRGYVCDRPVTSVDEVTSALS